MGCDVLASWNKRVRECLSAEADKRATRLRSLACTLLMAVVGQRLAIFSQIGDGAIILNEAGGLRPVFWPQSGEYINTTNFITDEEFDRRLEIVVHPGPVDELAVLTDGLQMLALRYADKSVHRPFFLPMFRALRAAESASLLERPMHEFLTSKAVNDRTDDDKTLILATRRLPNDTEPLRQPEPAG
jgi:hypothetical protein